MFVLNPTEKMKVAFSHPQHSSAHAAKLRKKAGAYLKNLREIAGITQIEIAEHCGFRYSQMIGQIEHGRVRLPPDKYVLYAQALGVDPREMVKRLLWWYDPYTAAALFPKPLGAPDESSD